MAHASSSLTMPLRNATRKRDVCGAGHSSTAKRVDVGQSYDARRGDAHDADDGDGEQVGERHSRARTTHAHAKEHALECRLDQELRYAAFAGVQQLDQVLPPLGEVAQGVDTCSALHSQRKLSRHSQR